MKRRTRMNVPLVKKAGRVHGERVDRFKPLESIEAVKQVKLERSLRGIRMPVGPILDTWDLAEMVALSIMANFNTTIPYPPERQIRSRVENCITNKSPPQSREECRMCTTGPQLPRRGVLRNIRTNRGPCQHPIPDTRLMHMLPSTKGWMRAINRVYLNPGLLSFPWPISFILPHLLEATRRLRIIFPWQVVFRLQTAAAFPLFSPTSRLNIQLPIITPLNNAIFMPPCLVIQTGKAKLSDLSIQMDQMIRPRGSAPS